MHEQLISLFETTGFQYLDWRMMVMWAVVLVLLYLAVYKNFEPLLLVPIAFGALLANLPTEGMLNKPAGEIVSPVSGVVMEIAVEKGEYFKFPHVIKKENLAQTKLFVVKALGGDEQESVDVTKSMSEEFVHGRPQYNKEC